MDGHPIWLNECEKINFDANPRQYEEGTRTSEDAARQLGLMFQNSKSIVFEGQDMAIVVINAFVHQIESIERKIEENIGI